MTFDMDVVSEKDIYGLQATLGRQTHNGETKYRKCKRLGKKKFKQAVTYDSTGTLATVHFDCPYISANQEKVQNMT